MQHKKLTNSINTINVNTTDTNINKLKEKLENLKKEEAYDSEKLTESERALTYNSSQRENLQNEVTKINAQTGEARNILQKTIDEIQNSK